LAYAGQGIKDMLIGLDRPVQREFDEFMEKLKEVL